MSRAPRHAAVRPFRITRSAVEAHRQHAPTPFLGCPLCMRQTMHAAQIRWSSPRLG